VRPVAPQNVVRRECWPRYSGGRPIGQSSDLDVRWRPLDMCESSAASAFATAQSGQLTPTADVIGARRSPSRVLASDSTDERPDLRIESELPLRLQARSGGREQGVQQMKYGRALACPERGHVKRLCGRRGSEEAPVFRPAQNLLHSRDGSRALAMANNSSNLARKPAMIRSGSGTSPASVITPTLTLPS
jgi:hypothetical protein